MYSIVIRGRFVPGGQNARDARALSPALRREGRRGRLPGLRQRLLLVRPQAVEVGGGQQGEQRVAGGTGEGE